MNIVIRDRTPFEQLNPGDVAAYLRNSGWIEVESQPDRMSVWTSKIDREEIEIILPLRRTLGDYVLRMSEVVGGIAARENRSQLEVLSDLQTAGADVIRVRFRHANANDGSIPLEQGEALIDNAREMMLAGACAVVQPKAYYATKRPDDAVEFVRRLRMGQTERGSFVLAIHSPVSPIIPGRQGVLFTPDDPFERRAIIKLATALQSLRSATDQSLTTPDTDVFERLIPEGVSANLCSAIVGMNGKQSQHGDELRISFTYARSRPAEASVPREIIIPSDHIGLIDEASRLYRRKAPPEETEIRGFVVQLKSEDINKPIAGPVTIKGYVRGEPRRIHIELGSEDHDLAALAYRDRAEIICSGEIIQQGNIWTLKNPQRFTIVSDD